MLVKVVIDDIGGDAEMVDGPHDLGGNRRPPSVVTIILRFVLIGLKKGK
jgi:hypothetical protein